MAEQIEQGYQAHTSIETYQGEKAVVKRINHPKIPIISTLESWLLEREARTLRALGDIDSVPEFLGYPDQYSFTMKFREGKTLREHDQLDQLPLSFYEKLIGDVEKIHRRGYVHSDLKKKENILVSPQNEPVILDFGSAFRKKASYRLVNNFFYKQFETIDRHAVLKLKYRGRPEAFTDAEREEVMNLVLLEKLSRWGRKLLPFRMDPPPLEQRYD